MKLCHFEKIFGKLANQNVTFDLRKTPRALFHNFLVEFWVILVENFYFMFLNVLHKLLNIEWLSNQSFTVVGVVGGLICNFVTSSA